MFIQKHYWLFAVCIMVLIVSFSKVDAQTFNSNGTYKVGNAATSPSSPNDPNKKRGIVRMLGTTAQSGTISGTGTGSGNAQTNRMPGTVI